MIRLEEEAESAEGLRDDFFGKWAGNWVPPTESRHSLEDNDAGFMQSVSGRGRGRDGVFCDCQLDDSLPCGGSLLGVMSVFPLWCGGWTGNYPTVLLFL